MSSRLKLNNCFDSHLHWSATGLVKRQVDLSQLTKPEDVLNINLKQENYRGEWLLGYGWDDNPWSSKPTKQVLDKKLNTMPVAFWRVDGHALWVNSVALKLAGIDNNTPDPQGGKIVRDENNNATGVLVDTAMFLVEKFIPAEGAQDIKNNLLHAMRLFNGNGFTHIRDMSCSETQWQQEVSLDQNNELSIYIDQWISADDPNDFEKALKLAKEAKKEKLKNIKLKGVKIFYDGALGSEGAYLSENYLGSQNNGLRLLKPEELKNCLKEVWQNDLDVAIHAIGDQASLEIAQVAHSLWSEGLRGRLHIEHAEMMQEKTVQLLKGQNVVCHIQPCHWMSDKAWIENKINHLKQHLFQWRLLEENKIAFNFGSDCPIEPMDIFLNKQSLDDAEKFGIKNIQNNWQAYHQYYDPSVTPDTYTEFENEKVKSVYFRGEKVI